MRSRTWRRRRHDECSLRRTNLLRPTSWGGSCPSQSLPLPVPPPTPPAQHQVKGERRSIRIASRPNAGLNSEQAAQLQVARRLGSLPPLATSFSDELIQAYQLIYHGPLPEETIGAIEDLVTAVKKLKKG